MRTIKVIKRVDQVKKTIPTKPEPKISVESCIKNWISEHRQEKERQMQDDRRVFYGQEIS